MRSFAVALVVFCFGLLIAGAAAGAPSRPSATSAQGPNQFLLQTQAPSTALPVLSQVRANEASSQAPPAGQVYIESLPGTPPPFAADPNDQGQNGSQQARIVRRTQPVSRILQSKRFGPNEAMGALNVTGINHWWTYEEDGIGGVGRYLVNVGTGNLIVQADDMAIAHKGLALAFRRTYNSYSQHDYANTDGSVPNNYGDGWTNTFDAHIAQNTLNDPHCGKTGISVYDIDGARYDYAIQYNAQTQTCSYIAPTGQFAVLTFDTASGLYFWTKSMGTAYMFHSPTDANAGVAGRLSKIWARNNNCTLTFTYSFDSGQTKSATTLNKITVQTESTVGASLTATLTFRTFTGINQSSHRLLSSLAWPDGTAVSYKYDSSGRLSEVDEPANTIGGTSIPQIYTYGSSGYLLATVAGGRWSTSNGTDGGTIAFDYSGSSVVDAKYYGWVNPMVPDASGPTLLQPGVGSNYGTVAGTPYRFVTFNQWGAGTAPSPAPTSSPSAAPAACTSSGALSWYDSDGHEAIFCYDSNGRVVQTDGWSGTLWLVTTQGWDSKNDLISARDARGDETDFAYDATGNLIEQAAPSASVIVNGSPVAMRSTWLYSYDVHNNLTARCDPVVVHTAGKDWSTPPPQSDTLCSTANGLNNFSSVTWNTSNTYEPYGELTAVTSTLGYTSTVSHSTGAQGGVDYGLVSSVIGASFSQGASTTTPEDSYIYDSFGDVICASRAISASASAVSGFVYDSDNRVTAVLDPDDGSSLNPAVCAKPTNTYTIATRTTYNPNGSVATMTTPGEAAAGVSTQYAYDADGNKVSEVDHFGGPADTTSNYYDGAERLVEVVKPHDANSDLFNLAWITRYDYDLSAGAGDTVTTLGSNSQMYSVAGHGDLYATMMLVNTYANGSPGTPYWEPTQFDSFDSLDRPIANYRPRPSDCSPYGLTPAGVADCDTFGVSTTTYDFSLPTLGLKTSTVQSPTSTLDYVYDATDRITTQEVQVGSSPVPERSYAYDPDGRDAQVSLSGVGTEVMTYDVEGRETSLQEPSPTNFTAPTTYNYSYYANDWMSGVSATPKPGATPVQIAYTYRWDGKPATTNLTYGSDGYTFTSNETTGGRETSMDDYYYPGPSPSGSPCPTTQVDARCERYDHFGRLQTLAIPEGTYGSVGYDPEGNMTAYSAGGATISNYYNQRGEFYKDASTMQGARAVTMMAMMGYVNTFLNTLGGGDIVDIRAGVKTGGMPMCVDGCPVGEPMWSMRATYDSQGRETDVGEVFGISDHQGGTTYVTGDDARAFDDENHLTGENFTTWNCSGATSGPLEALSSPSASYVWGPNNHPIMSTLNFGSPRTESLHWSGDQLLFTSDSNGNVDDIKVGSVADYIPGATASTRLTVWDRDLSGSIASAHNGTGNAIWANQPVQGSVCASTPTFENSLGYEANPSPGFTLPSGLASVFASILVVPSGLFVASRADNVTNQLTTFQGSRVYDPSKNDWMTPDSLSGVVTDPSSQRAYAFDRNSPFTYADPSGFKPDLGGNADPYGTQAATNGASDLNSSLFESDVEDQDNTQQSRESLNDSGGPPKTPTGPDDCSSSSQCQQAPEPCDAPCEQQLEQQALDDLQGYRDAGYTDQEISDAQDIVLAARNAEFNSSGSKTYSQRTIDLAGKMFVGKGTIEQMSDGSGFYRDEGTLRYSFRSATARAGGGKASANFEVKLQTESGKWLDLLDYHVVEN